MVGHIGVHATQHANVVDTFADIRENLADLDPRLPIFLELERRLHQVAGRPFGLDVGCRGLLTVILRQQRFRIEGIHLRRTTVHEEMNDALGFGLEVRGFRGQRRTGCFHRRIGGQETLLLENRRETEATKAGAEALQQVAARENERVHGVGDSVTGVSWFR